MRLDDLLRNPAATPFLRETYLRTPFAAPGAAMAQAAYCGWDDLPRLVAAPDADVVVSDGGRAIDDVVLTAARPGRDWRGRGWSLAIRHAERHDERLAMLAAAFATAFDGPVDVQVHATPAGHHGFGWHVDPEEVFIVQCAGAKDWFLRRNTVHRDPLPDAMPPASAYAAETAPALHCRLEAGDWLYIPGGWWHVARAIDSDALSLAIGVMAATPLALLDLLRVELAADPRWRRRLPPPVGDAAAVEGAWTQTLASAAEGLAARLRDPRLAEFWSTRQRHAAAALFAGSA